MATTHHLFLSTLLLLLFSSSHSSPGGPSETPTTTSSTTAAAASKNPFAAKAAVIRYWNRKVPNNRPRPSFLLSKLSPLSAVDSATYSSLAATDPFALTSRLPAFCSAARLLCSPLLTPSLSSSHHGDTKFSTYNNINFTNYGTGLAGGVDSFKNYSDTLDNHQDSFRRYSRDAVGTADSFLSYSPDGNVVTSNFTSYSSSATGGSGDFKSYAHGSNVPDLGFTNYDTDANGPVRTFSSYSDDTNSGDQSFASYGKSGNGVPTTFTSYANNSNVITSGFSGYGEDANGAADTFSGYGDNGNVPELTFKSYGSNGNAGTDSFSSYRDDSNVGDDFFTSYGKNENAGTAVFANYGNSFNPGSDNFKGYGEDSGNDNITFKGYSGDNTTFKSYAHKKDVSFQAYKKPAAVLDAVKESGKPVNRWVEPGKFFRESNLKKGTVMPMPDIRDKMPARSFLPRSIARKIPFSAAAVEGIFSMAPGTAMGKAVEDTVAESERAPSRGETKRCATSAEDMIDFAVPVLGSDVVVRSTESTVGSKGNVLIGDVKGINGGKLTKSVSCHQSLFPYLVYYCHSVPKVRVYEADILSVETNEKINHGVAICHIDTSDWSAGHGAFVALGSAPGKIEVCHWIFEGDMTWAAAD